VIHPGRANVAKTELQEKVAEVNMLIILTKSQVLINLFILDVQSQGDQ
jgi:hypothetical protein